MGPDLGAGHIPGSRFVRVVPVETRPRRQGGFMGAGIKAIGRPVAF
jgi:hypothetical protein